MKTMSVVSGPLSVERTACPKEWRRRLVSAIDNEELTTDQ
jgi:hypothetical protein